MTRRGVGKYDFLACPESLQKKQSVLTGANDLVIPDNTRRLTGSSLVMNTIFNVKFSIAGEGRCELRR